MTDHSALAIAYAEAAAVARAQGWHELAAQNERAAARHSAKAARRPCDGR